ncbi:MAG: hypothetical protein P4M11_11925 [Candidatus Pacebacteria bacterium]|nr:hypothetical protein [Candidatus Paceibacterota bacterium]
MEETKEPKVGGIGYNANHVCDVEFRKYGADITMQIYQSTNDPRHFFFEPFCIPKCAEESGRLRCRSYLRPDGRRGVKLSVYVKDQRWTEEAVRRKLQSMGKSEAEVGKLAISMANFNMIDIELPDEFYKGAALVTQRMKFDCQLNMFEVEFALEKSVDEREFVSYLENASLSVRLYMSQQVCREVLTSTERISWSSIVASGEIKELAGEGDVFYVRRNEAKELLRKATISCTHMKYEEFKIEDSRVNDKIFDNVLSQCKLVDEFLTEEQYQEMRKHTYNMKDIEPHVVKSEKSKKHDKSATSEEKKTKLAAKAGLNIAPFGVKMGFDRKSGQKVSAEDEHDEDHEFEGQIQIPKTLEIFELSRMELSKQVDAVSCFIKGVPRAISLFRKILPVRSSCESSVHIGEAQLPLPDERSSNACIWCGCMIGSGNCCEKCANAHKCEVCAGKKELVDRAKGKRQQCPFCDGQGYLLP